MIVKSYQEFINEEINWKGIVAGAAILIAVTSCRKTNIEDYNGNKYFLPHDYQNSGIVNSIDSISPNKYVLNINTSDSIKIKLNIDSLLDSVSVGDKVYLCRKGFGNVQVSKTPPEIPIRKTDEIYIEYKLNRAKLYISYNGKLFTHKPTEKCNKITVRRNLVDNFMKSLESLKLKSGWNNYYVNISGDIKLLNISKSFKSGYDLTIKKD